MLKNPMKKKVICWCTPKLVNKFKCESEMKTAEGSGVGACSLAHSK
jgi:hypothetical protein